MPKRKTLKIRIVKYINRRFSDLKVKQVVFNIGR